MDSVNQEDSCKDSPFPKYISISIGKTRCVSRQSSITNYSEIADIYEEVTDEVERAKQKFPDHPTDIVYVIAIMAEEAGECVKAALDCVYKNSPVEDLKTELIQTMAMCVRALETLNKREKK